LSAETTFLVDYDLKMNHVEFQKKAIEHFEQNKMEDSDSNSTGMVLDQLKKVSYLIIKI